MDPSDLAIFREIAAFSEELTGYPMVSGFHEFLYAADTPLYGDLSEYAYHHRGCIAYVVELWDIFHRLGLERPDKFVEHYTHLERADLERLARWDRDENGGRVFVPWRAARHPQLGEVEVGGLDPRIGLWNPPPERLADICADQSAAFLRVAAMAPALSVSRLERERAGDATRLTIAVDNLGYLPTYILSSARGLQHAEPLTVEARAVGCELLDASDARRSAGHLEGWGRGRFASDTLLTYARSRGNQSRAVLSYLVRGHGVLELRVGSCRVGWLDHREEI